MSTRPGTTSLPFASIVCFARASAISGSSAAITALRMPMSRLARSFWLGSSTSPPLITRSNLSVWARAPAPEARRAPPAAAPIRKSLLVCMGVSLFLLRLGLGGAGMLGRAAVADHAHRLDLDFDARARKVGHGDKRAARVVAVLEHVLPHLDEAVAVARLLDEHGHGDDVGEAAAGALEHLVDLREHLLHLRLEVVGDVLAVVVARCRLPGDPDGLAAVGDDAGRERPRQLERRFFHVLGGGRHGRQRDGKEQKGPQARRHCFLPWSGGAKRANASATGTATQARTMRPFNQEGAACATPVCGWLRRWRQRRGCSVSSIATCRRRRSTSSGSSI